MQEEASRVMAVLGGTKCRTRCAHTTRPMISYRPGPRLFSVQVQRSYRSLQYSHVLPVLVLCICFNEEHDKTLVLMTKNHITSRSQTMVISVAEFHLATYASPSTVTVAMHQSNSGWSVQSTPCLLVTLRVHPNDAMLQTLETFVNAQSTDPPIFLVCPVMRL
jgi:hypothetical protein